MTKTTRKVWESNTDCGVCGSHGWTTKMQIVGHICETCLKEVEEDTKENN